MRTEEVIIPVNSGLLDNMSFIKPPVPVSYLENEAVGEVIGEVAGLTIESDETSGWKPIPRGTDNLFQALADAYARFVWPGHWFRWKQRTRSREYGSNCPLRGSCILRCH